MLVDHRHDTSYGYVSTTAKLKPLPAILKMKKIKLLAIFVFSMVHLLHGQESSICKYENDSMVLTCGCIFYIDCHVQFVNWETEFDSRIECICEQINDFLNKHPNVKIEIGLHSDIGSGDTIESKKITDRHVKVYSGKLQSLGIDKAKYSIISYGLEKPRLVDFEECYKYKFLPKGVLLDNKFIESLTSIEEKEVAHSLNRRTEIKIVEIKNSR